MKNLWLLCFFVLMTLVLPPNSHGEQAWIHSVYLEKGTFENLDKVRLELKNDNTDHRFLFFRLHNMLSPKENKKYEIWEGFYINKMTGQIYNNITPAISQAGSIYATDESEKYDIQVEVIDDNILISGSLKQKFDRKEIRLVIDIGTGKILTVGLSKDSIPLKYWSGWKRLVPPPLRRFLLENQYSESFDFSSCSSLLEI